MQSKRLACTIGIVSVLFAGGIVWAQSAPLEKAPGADSLPQVIPIFPLEEAMLFPGVSRPLYIFEPRYRTMVADALKGDRIIGMTTLKPGYEANYEGRPPVYAIGCRRSNYGRRRAVGWTIQHPAARACEVSRHWRR